MYLVIGSIFLDCDELLRVRELVVGPSMNHVSDRGFQVHMPASTCLIEEGVGVILPPPFPPQWSCYLASHLAIRLHDIFQAVELPVGIANLDISLASVRGAALTRGCCFAAARLWQTRREAVYFYTSTLRQLLWENLLGFFLQCRDFLLLLRNTSSISSSTLYGFHGVTQVYRIALRNEKCRRTVRNHFLLLHAVCWREELLVWSDEHHMAF